MDKRILTEEPATAENAAPQGQDSLVLLQVPAAPAKVQWTPAQRKAIDYCGGDLLLSAAAGSGKTATLTERIVSLLTAKDSTAELSRMLCVTFTRAAASELKARIGRALREAVAKEGSTGRLTRQLCDLPRAQITTIHAFCLGVLRPHFAELSLPAGFSVAEEADIRALSRRVMTDVISAFFTEGAPDFLALADTLAGARDEASLDGVLLTLADKLSGHGMDGDDLARLADGLASHTAFFASPAGAGVRTRVLRFAEHYRTVFSDICADFAEDDILAVKYLPTARENCRLAEALCTAAAAGDYTACRTALLAYDPPKLGSVAAKDQTATGEFFKDVRKRFDAEVKKLTSRTFTLTEAEIAAVTAQTADIARAAARVLRAYFAELTARKRERGTVDFSDLETLTARLLMGEDGRPTPIAEEVAAAYDYIFIDEYQDTNRAQDAIFTAIAGHSHRFMVGDIKQSIYRFRGAEPEVFAAYRRRWAPLAEEAPAAASLFMRENFRCDETVVDFVNLVSRHMFRRGTIPFTAEDELAFAKAVPADYTPAPVEVLLFAKPKRTRAEAEQTEDVPPTEPQYVAARIAQLLATGRRADGKAFTPGDIAILLRSPGTHGAAFAAALKARGIPVSHGSAAPLFSRPEVLYALSILRAIDNPTRDIDLAAAMRGEVFGFDLSDLVGIRSTCHAGSLWDAVRVAAGLLPADEADAAPSDDLARRCLAFVERLTALRTDARGMRADALLLRLFRETGLYEIAADPAREANDTAAGLRALYDLARRFEAGRGGGLFLFLKTVEEAVEAGEKTASEESADAVRIMSIHHAKGLEFPVCFLCCADKPRSRKDTADALLFDPALGAVMRLCSPGGLVRCDTPPRRSLICAMEDAGAEEEMRVLYVALTRAKERLIVTAALADPAEALAAVEHSPEVPYFSAETVFAATDYITWILHAIAEAHLCGEDTSFVRLRVAASVEADAPSRTSDAPAAPDVLDADAVAATAARIREKLAFTYPRRHLAAVPAKLTVSRLYPGVLDAEEDAALPDAQGIFADRPAPPAYLSGRVEADAAFAGTATHVFLQFADFDRLLTDGVQREKERLLAEGFLTAEMAAAIREAELCRFVESDLFARVRGATFLRRELRFNAALPAADFTEDAALKDALASDGTDIVVQGVIDLLFIDADGRAVLADYKTDRLTAAEIASPALAAEKLIPRHERQLRYYRAVAAQMLGRPIDECLLYSLPLGGTLSL